MVLGTPDMALFLFMRNILAGKPIDVFNYGNHQRDFTYVDDIAEGVVRTLDRVATPNPDWNSDDPDPATSRLISHLQHRQQPACAAVALH
jgi:UDP-glucuronate 4-epimerase